MQRVVAGTLDVVCILVFVVIGRSSHADGVTVAGVASTSWPFLAGAVAGWTTVRAWRQPMAIVPTGVVVWIACVTVGMVLRVVAGQGTAIAFVAVALAFLGMELLGWRALARLVPTPHRRRGDMEAGAGSPDPRSRPPVGDRR